MEGYAMSLFDKTCDKQNNDNMNVYVTFSNWIDKHLSNDLPNSVVAINFNLYEGSEETYDVQIIGSDSFDEDNDDWACGEIYTTGEDVFFVPRTKHIAEWEEGLSFITALVEKYLREGKYANKLKNYEAVGIGFVDGDITILHRQ